MLSVLLSRVCHLLKEGLTHLRVTSVQLWQQRVRKTITNCAAKIRELRNNERNGVRIYWLHRAESCTVWVFRVAHVKVGFNVPEFY